jgi:metal-dependent amidase/aminoacylase/carboxypeptidase family protein
VREVQKITGSEDFSLYARKVPGVFLFLGVTPKADLATAASNHSPLFQVDESALPTGVRAYAQVAADYLFAHAKPPRKAQGNAQGTAQGKAQRKDY